MASSEDATSTGTTGREKRGDRRIVFAAVLIGVLALALLLVIILSPEITVNAKDFSYNEIPTQSNASVRVTNVNGKISLSSGSQSSVSITGKVTARGLGSAPEQVGLRESNTNGEITLEAVFPTVSSILQSQTYDVQITLSIPSSVRFALVQIVNSNGSVDVGVLNASSVHVETVNGGVSLNCGSCEKVVASTTNGPVSATFASFSAVGQYTMTSVNGNVVAIVPSNSGFNFDAATTYGT
ncbi:MAG TPA: DUF4097 family beta strand repeat-containing protein, partial [Candidatus Binatus sp.]|nr:DUF4097 family beta strand repeat-containing protein [Candidatus Binatus sp.]